MKTQLVVIFILAALATQAQQQRPWEPMLAAIMTTDDMDSDDWDDTYQLLCQIEQHPIDLNSATREDLEQLPFLSDQQVEAIMEYLYHYAPMKSMAELRMIRSLDYTQIALLSHFACVVVPRHEQAGLPRLKDIVRNAHHELTVSARIPFYRRQGDDNGYLGSPYRHTLRYQLSSGNLLKLGLVGAQDAGEPFFSGRNGAGYDFYSYYLQLKHLGHLENLVVGKYKLSAGMGLVLNNSLSLGKLAMLQQMGRAATTLRPHASRSQASHFQGAAATVRLSHRVTLTPFLSYRALDATLGHDSTATSLVTSGYHRTPSEMEKKNNTHTTDLGAHIAYRYGRLHAGATALYTHLDRRLQPNASTLYRRHYAQGSDFVNLSANYGYLHHSLAFHGETAINRHGAVATINSLSVNTANSLSIMLLQRFYSYRYTALYARALSEGGRVQNESSIYTALSWQPSPRLRLMAYSDYTYFAWVRYQVSSSSHAWDNLLQATLNSRCWTLTARYRLHLRQKDRTITFSREGKEIDSTLLADIYEHRSRLTLAWHALDHVTTTTQADGVITTSIADRHWGYMISQAVNAQWAKVKLSATTGYFLTSSYDARLYVYERSPLYSFSIPAYYGQGLRLSLMAQTTATRRLTLTAKLGYTRYFDRSTIGSDLQQVEGSALTDLDLQVRWKF